MLRCSVQKGYVKMLCEARLHKDVLRSNAMLRRCVRQGYVKTCCEARQC